MLCGPKPGGLLAFVQVWSCVYSNLFSSVYLMWTETIFALLVSAVLFFATLKRFYYERNWAREPKWPLMAEWEKFFSFTKPTLFIVRSRVLLHLEILMIIFALSWHVLPPRCAFSPLRRSLLRAVWCHPFTGVARLLQRLAELWVGHWGWDRKLHQDQLWQVCKTVLQPLSCGNKNMSRARTAFFVSESTVALHLSGRKCVYIDRGLCLCCENNTRWLRVKATLCRF